MFCNSWLCLWHDFSLHKIRMTQHLIMCAEVPHDEDFIIHLKGTSMSLLSQFNTKPWASLPTGEKSQVQIPQQWGHTLPAQRCRTEHRSRLILPDIFRCCCSPANKEPEHTQRILEVQWLRHTNGEDFIHRLQICKDKYESPTANSFFFGWLFFFNFRNFLECFMTCSFY